MSSDVLEVEHRKYLDPAGATRFKYSWSGSSSQTTKKTLVDKIASHRGTMLFKNTVNTYSYNVFLLIYSVNKSRDKDSTCTFSDNQFMVNYGLEQILGFIACYSV